MKRLGHSLTWSTTCFIDGGCGQAVLAHTNGRGDFVLFDSLGFPWPVHECHENRFCRRVDKGAPTTSRFIVAKLNYNLMLREDRASEYKGVEEPFPQRQVLANSLDIVKVDPVFYLGSRDPLKVQGIVRSIIRNQLSTLLLKVGDIGAEVATKVLGKRQSQITVVDVDLASITAFVDLQNIALSIGDLVEILAKAVAVPPLHPPHRFVCERVTRVDLWINRA